eukprot:scaffold34612_cov165-Amphora_coffeaeformis.AAC.5
MISREEFSPQQQQECARDPEVFDVCCSKQSFITDTVVGYSNKMKIINRNNGNPPRWFRTPLAQTVTLGIVFFFVFSSYTTIQFYARTTYGPELAANSVAAVYATFTTACLIAPSITNKFGSRVVLFWGVLGYAALVAASLVYFVYGVESIVVWGGGILGVGAALLWTGQGRLVLDYAAVAPEQSGTLMGIFWAVFQGSALVGGIISFSFYSESPSGGSVWLYIIFLAFIVLGALSTQLLLPPGMLLASSAKRHKDEKTDLLPAVDEKTSLLPSTSSTLSLASVDTQPVEVASVLDESSSWFEQAKKTLQLFWTRPMQILCTLFFYTGLNQPYQQATFSNRFFSRRTIGLEMVVFHVFEIVGAIHVGKALDADPTKRKQLAVQCLLWFIVVNTSGNLLAWYQEIEASLDGAVAVDITDSRSLLPSLALACWGFADSQIQVYVYWLLGTLFETGDDHARAVGFYKCIQSLGVSIGFSLTPLTRLTALRQLALSSAVYVVGTLLAFGQLPK